MVAHATSRLAYLPSERKECCHDHTASGPLRGPTPPIGNRPDVGPDGPIPERVVKRRRWPWVAGIVVAFVVGAGIGASGDDSAPADAADGVTDRQVAELQASLDGAREQLARVSSERDEAVEELEAAKTERDTASENLAAAENERDDAIIRAEDAEAALTTAEEAAANQAAEAGAAGEQVGDGTWLVGEDIEPGVYRNSGDGSSCYWERLSGLSGELGDIIANGIPDGPVVVEIAGSDVAFSSQGCGTWTNQ